MTGDLSSALGLGAPTEPPASAQTLDATGGPQQDSPADGRRTESRYADRPASRGSRSDSDRFGGPRHRDEQRGGQRGSFHPREDRPREDRAPREPELGSRRRAEDIGERWPEIPEWATSDELDPEVRRDLRGLSREGSEFVAGHLVAASALADEEPEEAWRHARAARTRGGRIAVVRETVGLVAYRAGEWAEAIGELRAARRMSGGAGQLAVLADCERALGHPERAIELSRSPEAETLDAEQRTELVIVSAGARADLGQIDAAVAQLEQLAATTPDSARVAFAYADLLERAGRREDAITWFIKAADADLDEETDAAERLVALGADPQPEASASQVDDEQSTVDPEVPAPTTDEDVTAVPMPDHATDDAGVPQTVAAQSEDVGDEPGDAGSVAQTAGSADDLDPFAIASASTEADATASDAESADDDSASGSDSRSDDEPSSPTFSGSPLFSDNPTTGA